MNKHVETAFSCHGPSGQVFEYGLTKREWFAGMALQGMMANIETAKAIQRRPNTSDATRDIAAAALVIAEAMLTALAEKGNDQ